MGGYRPPENENVWAPEPGLHSHPTHTKGSAQYWCCRTGGRGPVAPGDDPTFPPPHSGLLKEMMTPATTRTRLWLGTVNLIYSVTQFPPGRATRMSVSLRKTDATA